MLILYTSNSKVTAQGWSAAGMQKIVAASEHLQKWPEFRAVGNLKSIDVISVRLWLDRKIDFKFPANVLAGFEEQAGSTFFDLNTLQVHPSAGGRPTHEI